MYLVHTKKLIFIFAATFALSFFYYDSLAQDANNILAKKYADTLNFRVNKIDNWDIYNSDVSKTQGDSILLFVVIEHDRTDIDLSKKVEIGFLTNQLYRPKFNQILYFQLLNNRYIFYIETTGKCFLTLSEGILPDGNPIILPIQVKYSVG